MLLSKFERERLPDVSPLYLDYRALFLTQRLVERLRPSIATKMNARNTDALTRLIGGRIIITDGQYHACVTRCHEMSDERNVKVKPTCGV